MPDTAPTDAHTRYDAYTAPLRTGRDARRVGVRQAFDAIPNGARVVIPTLSGVPMGLVDALAAQRDRWRQLEIVCGILPHRIAPLDHAGAPFTFTTWQFSAPLAAAQEAGALQVIPARYSHTVDLFAPDGPHPIDAMLVQVSPPGPEGRVSLGLSGGATIDMVRQSRCVIAQINANVPYTFGASEFPLDAFDLLVEIDTPLVRLDRSQPGPVEQRIAEHVLSLVPAGATLQFGIGAVPEAIMALLPTGHDYGIHSGLISDGVIDIVESGAVTNARKTDDQDAAVCAEVSGTPRLFEWVHRNPRVRLAPGRYTHGLPVLSRAHALSAINSAVQVSLDGAVNAESVGDRLLSGPGGQPDFAEAAHWSPGAVGIIALPATAAGGKASRIVSRIDGVTTVPRHLADRVVTEHGVASLRGRTIRERAESLRAIADPAFRDQLLTP